jgi:hypothetical protein
VARGLIASAWLKGFSNLIYFLLLRKFDFVLQRYIDVGSKSELKVNLLRFAGVFMVPGV